MIFIEAKTFCSLFSVSLPRGQPKVSAHLHSLVGGVQQNEQNGTQPSGGAYIIQIHRQFDLKFTHKIFGQNVKSEK